MSVCRPRGFRGPRGSGAVSVLALLFTVWGSSQAHPAGSTSVNRYVGVSCSSAGHVQLAYLLDFAELPAYAEIDQLDADHDGSVTPEEQRAYLERRLPPLVARWTVEIDGARVSPRITGSSLQVLPGERGLSTLRIAADVEAAPVLPIDPVHAGGLRVHLVDPGFADRSGWRQMAAEASPGMSVASGPAESASEALAYGNPAGEAPPRVDDATFVFRATPAVATPDAPPGSGASNARVPGPSRWSSEMQKIQTAWLHRLLVALAVGLTFALAAALPAGRAPAVTLATHCAPGSERISLKRRRARGPLRRGCPAKDPRKARRVRHLNCCGRVRHENVHRLRHARRSRLVAHLQRRHAGKRRRAHLLLRSVTEPFSQRSRGPHP